MQIDTCTKKVGQQATQSQEEDQLHFGLSGLDTHSCPPAILASGFFAGVTTQQGLDERIYDF